MRRKPDLGYSLSHEVLKTERGHILAFLLFFPFHRWPKCTSREVPPRKDLRLLSIAYLPTVTHIALPKAEGEKGYNRLDGVTWPPKLGKSPYSVGPQNTDEIFLIQSSHSWIIGQSAGEKPSSTYLSKQ